MNWIDGNRKFRTQFFATRLGEISCGLRLVAEHYGIGVAHDFVELSRVQYPYRRRRSFRQRRAKSEVQSDKSAVGPIQQPGGGVVMTHEEVPFPLILRLAFCNHLDAAAAKLASYLRFVGVFVTKETRNGIVFAVGAAKPQLQRSSLAKWQAVANLENSSQIAE